METGTVIGASCLDTAVMQDCLQHFTGQGLLFCQFTFTIGIRNFPDTVEGIRHEQAYFSLRVGVRLLKGILFAELLFLPP